ncbi:signal recognition particle 9 kDa protein isoform X1 [Bacillus rossius redtenbacheri]|uniref:signal recognition particle 9 kDa protein isoform X1 n=1 Tax=Bacillus rossius redtenbacheri TaxID=93214 RepID=UPI002FDE693B
MTYIKSWEEFEKAAEQLYLRNPMKVRYMMKYVNKEGCLALKLTDDVIGNHPLLWVVFQCLQYKTEILQDLKKVEKLTNNLMRHMASKESVA